MDKKLLNFQLLSLRPGIQNQTGYITCGFISRDYSVSDLAGERYYKN